MAKGAYIGVDGKARKIKKAYIGVDGKARKIKKVYVGVNGKARLCWSVIDPIFANNSWTEIAAACQYGYVPSTWKVGDQKSMTINGKEYLIDIIGKNQDAYADGSGMAPLTFQLHELYETKYAMDTDSAYAGGWTSCDMRNTYLPAIKKLMPSEVQSAIKSVSKKTRLGEQTQTTIDQLFLLSEVEIYGNASYSEDGEGVQYGYYASNVYSVARKADLKGTYNSWWCRSPQNTSNFNQSVIVQDSGLPNRTPNENLYGLSFAFCF